MGKTIAIAVLSYVAIGTGVLIWTAQRNGLGKNSFLGVGRGDKKPYIIMAETVGLWPLATYRNLVGYPVPATP
jgi:hypothetical protein